MKKVIRWFKESDRWKHLLGGYVIGLGADDWYCALYAGAGIGAALEYKDKAHGAKWDNIDLAMTVAGAVVGQTTRSVLMFLVK